MKESIIRIAFEFGKLTNYVLPHFLMLKIENFFHFVHSGRIHGQLLSCGFSLDLKFPTYLKGGKYMKIGNNFHALYRLRIEAWDQYNGIDFNPLITIGDNVSFSDNCHLGAINHVKIGNNVLFGSNVFITDHFHGSISISDDNIHPIERNLYSKGPVIIDDDVWVGDGVSIMPNITIGHSCIIGANSVVTRSFPASCVIAGCPAKIVKYLHN